MSLGEFTDELKLKSASSVSSKSPFPSLSPQSLSLSLPFACQADVLRVSVFRSTHNG